MTQPLLHWMLQQVFPADYELFARLDPGLFSPRSSVVFVFYIEILENF